MKPQRVAAASWRSRLARSQEALRDAAVVTRTGALTRVIGLTVEARGCPVALGDRCHIQTQDGMRLEAQAVGFDQDRTFLMPVQHAHGLRAGDRIARAPRGAQIAVGPGLLGRVIDAAGEPLDGHALQNIAEQVPLVAPPINPLDRALIEQPLDVGIRIINAINTVGRGQRVGLFAPSGVGKSVLLGMMTKFTAADVVVVGLVGERGREVGDFVHRTLGPQGLKRAVVVAAPADAPPLMRLQGALRATAIAEFFRAQGRHVLLLIDSLTRFAQAQREIALAVGEPPATKGYPPSVFAELPRLIERAGSLRSTGGSITAIYTVLTEEGDINDPVAYGARAILDGHVVLSRDIAERGRYPAVDLQSSVSRVMADIVPPAQLELAKRFRRMTALYQQNVDLIRIGAYRSGSDPELDQALRLHPVMEGFAGQPFDIAASLTHSQNDLRALFAAADARVQDAPA